MALYKSITLSNGTIANYHNIQSLKYLKETNETTVLIYSYLSETIRRDTNVPLTMNIQVVSGSINVLDCYAFLKTTGLLQDADNA